MFHGDTKMVKKIITYLPCALALEILEDVREDTCGGAKNQLLWLPC